MKTQLKTDKIHEPANIPSAVGILAGPSDNESA